MHNVDLAKTHYLDKHDHNETRVTLRKEGIYKKEELLDIYKNIMQKKNHVKNLFQIIFENDACIKCGIKGDRKLTRNSPCHIKVQIRHDKDENENDLIEEKSTLNTGRKHTGRIVTVRDEGWKIAKDIVGAIPIISIFQFIPDIGSETDMVLLWR
jgi:hypothetical protein